VRRLSAAAGTRVTFRPGVLMGGKIKHECPPSRSIGARAGVGWGGVMMGWDAVLAIMVLVREPDG